MTEERHDSKSEDEAVSDLSRRDFIAMSVAAGVVAATGSASAAAMPVVETDVTIKTPDGMCDAAFIHPGHWLASRRADLDGRVRLAPVDARDRQAHRRRRLLGAGAESLLSHGQGARVRQRALVQLHESGRHGEAAAVDGVDQRSRQCGEGCRGLHRVAGRSKHR